ncbi:MAG: hypothetical protein ACQETI_02540 [Halobacteriota archaeon]
MDSRHLNLALLVGAIALVGLLAAASPTSASPPVPDCPENNVTTANTTFEVQTCYDRGSHYMNSTYGVNTNYTNEVDVTNVGNESGSLSLSVAIDGNEVKSEAVALDSGGSASVQYERELADGTHTVTVSYQDPYNVTVVDSPYDPVIECLDHGDAWRDPCPNDLDGDGYYEDVDGNGVADFDDAITLAFVDPSSFTQAQVEAFDFDDDGEVSFRDAIELAFGA